MTDAKARLLQMIADEPHMGGGGLLKAVGKAQKAAKAAETGMRAILPAAEREANLAKMLEGSKVKERLYHGTGRDIKEFDKSKLRRTAFGEGFHLAESPNLANFYANQFDEGQNVMPVYAAIKNPYDLKNMHDWYDVPGDSNKDKTNFLKSQGYDGIKYPHGAGGDKTSPAPSVYVAFEPEQIKSAIGNQGTYDLTDPDITKAGGGLLKAVSKAQKAAKAGQEMSKVMQPIVSAAEHEANLARLLAPSKATMRLYHGTTATEGGKGTEAIRRLKPSKEGALGSGVYLTPSPAHASGYSGIPNDEAIELMLGNPSYQSTGMKALNQRNSGDVLPSQQGGNMLPVYAQIKNPLIIEGTHGDPMIEALTKLGMDEAQATKMVERAYETKGYIGKEVESRARAAGYDGLMQYRDGDLSEVVSYNPNAIKSAIGNRGTFDINEPDLSKATGGAVHMAGGGRTPKYPWERYEQPKKVAEMRAREINPVAGAVKKGADYATQLIDKGPSFADLMGNVVGAVPFVGPDLRKRMEASNISIPTDINLASNMPAENYEYGQPMQYRKPGISTTSVPTKDVLDAIKVSDLVGAPGLSSAAESIGYGQMPDAFDLLDAASVAGLGYGAIKGGLKGGRKAAGALSDLAKSEAGYKLAQKALEYAPAAQPMNVIKPTGGNWLSGETEKQLKKLQMGDTMPADYYTDRAKYLADAESKKDTRAINAINSDVDTAKRNDAINKWVESNLTNYVKKQMGTKDDPVRKLAEQGILHMEPYGTRDAGSLVMRKRAGLGYPAQGLGQSDTAKFWERLSDHAIDSYPAGSYKHGALDESLLENNPWLKNVPDETMIHSGKGLTRDLGFDHITDVLREDLAAGRIRPEQLSKVSMEQAVRRTHEYDQELAAKMKAARASAREGLPVYKEYPEGFRWMELNKPGAFASESEAMGHSVRGYEPPKGHPDWVEGSGDSGSLGYGHGGWEAIKSGNAKVYSLVDKEGQPHVTVEVKNSGMTPEQRTYKVGILTQRLIDEGNTPENAAAQAEKIYPEGEIKQFITQIKGKQNRAPKEDYLPFVQDFVKSGNWSDIGDIQNTGLRDLKKTPKLEEYLKRKNADVPRYLTQGEYEGHEGDFLMDELGKAAENDPLTQRLLNEQPRMAAGGAVSDAKQRLLDMIAKEPHMSGGGLLKAIGKAQKAAKATEKAAEVAAYSQKILDSTAAKLADKIAKANPKLSEAEVMSKATQQAKNKLDWERVQKPELEKVYGALAKSSYADSKPNKLQNTPEVVAERKRKANEFLSIPTEPWKPPPPELQAFDRSSIKDALEGFPGVEQTAFPRDIPTRANISHVDELYNDPENRSLIERQIKRGLPLGGETFYASLYPVKQAVMEAGMPAEKFEQWIHSLAPASARNSIMNEMSVGQLMRDMHARGIPLTEENVKRQMGEFQEKFGMGVPLMPIHRQGVQNVLEGGQNLREMSKANIPTNYKIPTYGTQKAGDFAKSVVLDVHEAAGQTQGSRFHPYFKEQGGFGNTEYNAGEQGLLSIAQDLGIPGGMAQAGRWFGGGELTGLRSPRGDALDLLEKQVAYTLSKKGVQPNPANIRAEVLRQISTGEGDLLPWYRKEEMPDVRQTGLQRKEGGEVKMAGGLAHCKTKKVKRHGNTVSN